MTQATANKNSVPSPPLHIVGQLKQSTTVILLFYFVCANLPPYVFWYAILRVPAVRNRPAPAADAGDQARGKVSRGVQAAPTSSSTCRSLSTGGFKCVCVSPSFVYRMCFGLVFKSLKTFLVATSTATSGMKFNIGLVFIQRNKMDEIHSKTFSQVLSVSPKVVWRGI